MQGGCVKCRGKSPSELGTPKWRTEVTYVHQSRVTYKGSPAAFFELAKNLAAQKGRPHGDLQEVIVQMGLDPRVLQQPWSELSVRNCWVKHYILCMIHCSLRSNMWCAVDFPDPARVLGSRGCQRDTMQKSMCGLWRTITVWCTDKVHFHLS
jgi:hypothetical protein